MDEQGRITLEESVKLRVPRHQQGEGARSFVERLEDFMLRSACHQGDLSEVRLELYSELQVLDLEWSHLSGYEPLLNRKTEAAVSDAKRQLEPDMHDRRSWLRWRIARIGEEIERLERDATKVSRVYTMLSGS